ncbi:hypothetical protein EJ03DRAFT_154188 [Teratosphaeria nubilosa]|uniref:Uncharacterized protein n=1 Tax=Teratosphaeria nubilosa TaxID=161662 RepID=A0A6G1LKL2_9PEZI|nr:hypothetical protein EJ03DRAFT_154188 [Teratosphaeria nubilosa]
MNSLSVSALFPPPSISTKVVIEVMITAEELDDRTKDATKLNPSQQDAGVLSPSHGISKMLIADCPRTVVQC